MVACNVVPKNSFQIEILLTLFARGSAIVCVLTRLPIKEISNDKLDGWHCYIITSHILTKYKIELSI